MFGIHTETMCESSTEASAEAQLQAIVDKAVKRAIAALTRNLPPPSPPGPPAEGKRVNGWRIEDLGYFNLDISEPADAPVKSLQNHTYYGASSWSVPKICKPSQARI